MASTWFKPFNQRTLWRQSKTQIKERILRKDQQGSYSMILFIANFDDSKSNIEIWSISEMSKNNLQWNVDTIIYCTICSTPDEMRDIQNTRWEDFCKSCNRSREVLPGDRSFWVISLAKKMDLVKLEHHKVVPIIETKFSRTLIVMDTTNWVNGAFTQ
jgi:hypothetical protein